MNIRHWVIVGFLIITLSFLWAAAQGVPEAKSALPWITCGVMVELANLVRKEDP